MSIPFAPDFTLGYDLVFCGYSTISTETDTDGVAIDTQLYEGPLHLFAIIGNSGDGSTVITVKLVECATSGGSYTAIDGSSEVLTASATANDSSTVMVKGENQLRYVKSRVVTLGGTPSVPIALALFARKKIGGGSGVLTTG